MNLKGIIKTLNNRVQIKYFPTLHQKEAERYFADGGDGQFRLDFDHLTENSLVFDLGGYKGQWASDIYSKYNCKVLIFEPVSTYYKKIVDRFKLNKKIEVFQLALGDSKKTEEIGLSDDGSSEFIKSGSTDIMEFEDVLEFFRKHNIDRINLLKINIEGGEYVLLRRLIETGLIKTIDQIHVQFHDFVPDAENQMNKICAELAITHNLTLQYKFVWENWVLKK